MCNDALEFAIVDFSSQLAANVADGADGVFGLSLAIFRHDRHRLQVKDKLSRSLPGFECKAWVACRSGYSNPGFKRRFIAV